MKVIKTSSSRKLGCGYAVRESENGGSLSKAETPVKRKQTWLNMISSWEIKYVRVIFQQRFCKALKQPRWPSLTLYKKEK